MEKLLKNIYESEKKKKCLGIIGKVSVITMALFFGMELLLLLLEGRYIVALEVAVTAALGYIAVSIARKVINAPRPFELYDFYEVKPKHKDGESFPSRHCYSAFVIATLAWVIDPVISIALFVVASLIAVTRVLLGIHFVRDVVCGALIGAVVGTIGIIIINLI